MGSRIVARLFGFLSTLTLLAVAMPAFSQTEATPEQWDKIVAAAKGEGKIVISHFTDRGFEPILKQFTEKYGIRVEASPGRPDSVIPKIVTEQQNGQYNWDVLLQPVNNVRLVLAPAGGLEPILPFLMLPEVVEDANWYGGLKAQIPDSSPVVFYDGLANLGTGIDVNRDKVGAADFKDWPDLLAPKWKKNFGIYYPGRPSNLTIALTCYRPALKSDAEWEDYVRAFFAQEPLASPEFRIVADWLVQGRFDVTIGGEGSYLDTVKAKLKKNVEAPVGTNLCGYPPDGTGRAISIPKNPPDRNAATLFVNWYLTRDVQDQIVKAFWSTGVQSTSRRKDVGHPDPAFRDRVISGFENGFLQGKGLMTDSDQGLKLQLKVIELAHAAGY
jgi:ABC-type Fe3+ transport system substrate-binding protein